jgi:hypothetical protein
MTEYDRVNVEPFSHASLVCADRHLTSAGTGRVTSLWLTYTDVGSSFDSLLQQENNPAAIENVHYYVDYNEWTFL